MGKIIQLYRNSLIFRLGARFIGEIIHDFERAH